MNKESLCSTDSAPGVATSGRDGLERVAHDAAESDAPMKEEPIDVALRKVAGFRWVAQDYGKSTCRSCGAQRIVDYGDHETPTTEKREPCSRSCPWRIVEEFDLATLRAALAQREAELKQQELVNARLRTSWTEDVGEARQRAERAESQLAQLQAENHRLYEENTRLSIGKVMAEHHKTLSLMGRSSYAEVVEDDLRAELAETQVKLEAALKASGDGPLRAALRALEVKWRERAALAARLAAEHEGDQAGNTHAFLKEKRVRLEQADELRDVLAAASVDQEG